MSSFVGHGLAALTIGRLQQTETDTKSYLFWQVCLLLAVFAPDIDYFIFQLNAPNNNGVRLTHSIFFSLIFPCFVIICLLVFNRRNIVSRGLQISLAGLSHLLFDTLVGSRLGDPWLYPFSTKNFVLPFGILPSSASIRFSNIYFYRNLLIEIGILIPASCLILHFAGKLKLNNLTIAGLISVFIIFLSWSLNLNR